MIHDNPYDQAEADGAAEDRRQALADGAEEAENERRQLGMAYWYQPYDNDAAYEPGDPKRSDFLDGKD